MIKVLITKQSAYPISSVKLRNAVKKLLAKHNITSDTRVSIAVVGETKMKELAKKFYKSSGVEPRGYMHPVLSFPSSEIRGEFVSPPSKINDLGEIVLSYKAVVDSANRESKLLDQVAVELIEHSVLHLLGIHHDDH